MSAAPIAVCVADLELTEPLPTLDGLGAFAAVRAVARVRGVPVAEVVVPVEGGAVRPDALVDALVSRHAEELTRHLVRRWLARPPGAPAPSWGELESGGDVGALAACAEPPEPALPAATVAVCTRDRPDDLARCLAALTALDYPGVDLLVVDNAPRTGATEALVRDRFPVVRYVREPRPGLDWARNRAVVEARGELLAFTDDDVVVDPGWLRALGRVFGASPAVMAVTGMIAPAELDTRAQLDFEAYCGFGHGWARRWCRRPRRAGLPEYWHHGGGWLGTGANMAFRRRVFDLLGGFDPALDVGTETQGGGDLEMFFRVVQEGHLLVYAPEALVRHRHRRGDDELRRQITTWGRGYHAYLRRSRRAYPEERRAFDRLARWWWGEYALRTVARGVRHGATVESTLRRREIVGTVRGVGSYDRAERAAAALLARYPDEPTILPRASAPRAPGAAPGPGPVRTVAVDAPITRPLDGVGAPAEVRVAATAGGRPLVQVAVAPEDDQVSVAQLHDALAAALARHLLATGGERVRGSLAGWLGRGLGAGRGGVVAGREGVLAG